MKTYDQFLNEASTWTPYIKKISTAQWAKKNANRFHAVMTNAGDETGLKPDTSPKDLVAGVVTPVTPKGKQNFIKKLKAVYGMDVGANIADQTVDNMTDKQLLKVLNLIAKASHLSPETFG